MSSSVPCSIGLLLTRASSTTTLARLVVCKALCKRGQGAHAALHLLVRTVCLTAIQHVITSQVPGLTKSVFLQMNIKFPFEGLSPEHSSIDTSPYEAHEVNAADITLWKYPLIVRLETLADKPAGTNTNGNANAHSLAERMAGAAMAPWVQSQTTYIVLGETAPDADDDSKVVRQRIYVQGQHYLLQARTFADCLPKFAFFLSLCAGAALCAAGMRLAAYESDDGALLSCTEDPLLAASAPKLACVFTCLGLADSYCSCFSVSHTAPLKVCALHCADARAPR